MSADFRALCADLLWALENAIRVIYHEDGTKHISTANPIVNRARAALADEPTVPEVVGSEWQPCAKLPITVHVREQRPGEQHVSTREGITPVQSDDLIMLGVAGEEYPIGRELFQRTYRMGSADEPAAPAPPADGEVAELVAEIRHFLAGYQQMRGLDPEHIYSIHRGDKMEAHITVSRLTRAADLLERLSPPQPVPVSERLPGPEDCDAEGRCWWFAPETEVDFGGWTFGTTEICANSQWVDWENTHWLPAHALPVPEVGE